MLSKMEWWRFDESDGVRRMIKQWEWGRRCVCWNKSIVWG